MPAVQAQNHLPHRRKSLAGAVAIPLPRGGQRSAGLADRLFGGADRRLPAGVSFADWRPLEAPLLESQPHRPKEKNRKMVARGIALPSTPDHTSDISMPRGTARVASGVSSEVWAEAS